MSKLAFLDIETNVFLCGEKLPNDKSNNRATTCKLEKKEKRNRKVVKS